MSKEEILAIHAPELIEGSQKRRILEAMTEYAHRAIEEAECVARQNYAEYPANQAILKLKEKY